MLYQSISATQGNWKAKQPVSTMPRKANSVRKTHTLLPPMPPISHRINACHENSSTHYMASWLYCYQKLL